MKKDSGVFSWSGGKDSSLALYHVLKEDKIDVKVLLANINSTRNRLSMHGVRRELIDAQAKSIGLPLEFVELPNQPSMDEFDILLQNKLGELKKRGIDHAIYGDIFLEDLRKYRVQQLEKVGLGHYFPIWKGNTKELVEEFIELGFKAITVCIKSELLDESFVGRIIDQDFVNELPDSVDPCGENGEFHSFVFDGPVFNHNISFKKGEIVYREYQAPKKKDKACTLSNETDSSKMGFWFCDLKPA